MLAPPKERAKGTFYLAEETLMTTTDRHEFKASAKSCSKLGIVKESLSSRQLGSLGMELIMGGGRETVAAAPSIC